MITQRGAARLLEDPSGPGLTRRLAHAVLAAGFAGEPRPVGRQLCYDEEAVRRLAAWPDVRFHDVPDECRHGILVVRTAATPGIALLSEERKRQGPFGPYRMSPWASLQLDVLLAAHGFVPTVVTVASYVLTTAALIAVRAEDEVAGPRGWRVRPVLGPPGDWSAAFTRTRLTTGPGSPWLLWTPGLQPFRAAW